jgi:hypothetical protein
MIIYVHMYFYFQVQKNGLSVALFVTCGVSSVAIFPYRSKEH